MRRVLGLFLIVSAVLPAIADSARASTLATIHVTTTSDTLRPNDGKCSLREALVSVDTFTASGPASGECRAGSSSRNHVILHAGATYTLTRNGLGENDGKTGDLDLLSVVLALDAGTGTAVIEGEAGWDDRILEVTGSVFSIRGIEVRGGFSPADGGGIDIHSSDAALRQVRVLHNQAAGDGGGLMIESSIAQVVRSLVNHNTGQRGGGIEESASTLTLQATTVAGNHAPIRGGGIDVDVSDLTLSSSTVSGNRAQDGGGISTADSRVDLLDATLSGNHAEGDGGGMRVEDLNDMTVFRSTIAANQAARGGTGSGGGVWTAATPNDDNPTILEGSILAGNTLGTGGTSGANCIGSIESAGDNVVGSTDGCDWHGTGSDALNVAAKLAPLADNGGAVKTHALKAGSPALDRDRDFGCTDIDGHLILTDARGKARPVDVDGDGFLECDSGAFEAQKSPTV
jgi:CSLREA domain-containing protein